MPLFVVCFVSCSSSEKCSGAAHRRLPGLTLVILTGLSVTVISKDGEPEFRAWGYRTEDGDEVTPDVICSSSLWQRFNALSVEQTLFHVGSRLEVSESSW